MNLQNLLLVAFIASLTTFSVVMVVVIVCFTEMKQDLIRRSEWLKVKLFVEPMKIIFRKREAEALRISILATMARGEILKSNDNHKHIQSLKT